MTVVPAVQGTLSVEQEDPGLAIKLKFMSEHERALIALVLKNPLKLAELRYKITDDYFLYEPNKIVYKSICTLTEDPNVNRIDLTTLHIECNKHGFEKCGIGPQYLMVLDQGAPDEHNFNYYLEQVKDAYSKYRLHSALNTCSSLLDKNASAVDGSATGKELIDRVASEITRLNLDSSLEEEAVSIADRVEDYVLERASGDKGLIGLPTGFPTLDKALSGLQDGTVTIVAGKAKAGKSSILMNIVEHLALPGPGKDFEPVPVLVISTEMYSDEDISRLLAMNSYIPEREISEGTAYADEHKKKVLDSSIRDIQAAQIYHRYMPSFNADEICSLITYYKLRYNIKLAVFDYIKMETKSSDGSARKREDQILGEITNALKMAAGKLRIPILTGCQINTRNDLIADSDRIARFANTIIEFRAKTEEELLQQQPLHQYGTHWLKITYCRSGPSRKIPVSFYKPCLKILEAEYYQDEEEEGDGSTINLSDTLTTPADYVQSLNSRFSQGIGSGIVNVVSESPIANDLLSSGTNGELLTDDDPYF